MTIALLGIILLSISLSMDALGVGVSYSLRKIKTSWLAKTIISLISVIITGAAILLGNVILLYVSATAAKVAGCTMLVLLGLYVIAGAIHCGKEGKDITKSLEEKNKDRTFTISFKTFKIVINFVKECLEENESKIVGAWQSIYLGLALSIDSFGAGLSSAVSGLNSFLIPISVGVFQFLFLGLGEVLGAKFAKFKNIDSRIFIFISGGILIGLSIMRIFV